MEINPMRTALVLLAVPIVHALLPAPHDLMHLHVEDLAIVMTAGAAASARYPTTGLRNGRPSPEH